MPTGPPDDEPTRPPSWDDVLSAVASGRERLVLETASGARAVLISEQELAHLERAVDQGAPSAVPTLTSREGEVLALVGEGLSGTDVAARLGLATNTVAQHLAAVRRKLGVHSSAAAVTSARQRGLLPGHRPLRVSDGRGAGSGSTHRSQRPAAPS